jgi:hypothetical protein
MNCEMRSWFWRPALLAVAGIVGWLNVAVAADPAPDKSQYHLFNPTPREQMREMSTDRPDQTESPYTVDAGHVQVEMDIVNYFYDETGGVTTEALAIAPVNLKFGLWNNVDVQFVLDSYVRVKTRTPGAPATEDDGTGDLLTRLKINLWGNDGGATALAFMPFVKWPLPQSSLRNGKTEGGIIIPMAVALPAGWGLGLMSEVDFVRDSSNAFDTEYFNTITFSHDIIGDLGGYVEFAALFTPESDAQWQGQIDVGLTYGLNENTQFDIGCNFGVTSVAPDYNPFVGLTVRY